MDYLKVVQSIFLFCLLILAKKSIEHVQNTTPMNPNLNLTETSLNNTNDTSWEKVEEYPKEKFNVIYNKILNELSLNDTSKKSILMLNSSETTDSMKQLQPCLKEACSTFMTTCYFAYVVGGARKMNLVFLQACKAEWLNTEKIVKAVKNVCKHYKIGFIDHTDPDDEFTRGFTFTKSVAPLDY